MFCACCYVVLNLSPSNRISKSKKQNIYKTGKLDIHKTQGKQFNNNVVSLFLFYYPKINT